MKYWIKIIIAVLLLFVSGSIYGQNEEILRMYQRITGKDLSSEIERLRSEKETETAREQIAEIDTLGIHEISLERERIAAKDSVEVKTFFERYVRREHINPYESELRQFSIDFSSVRTNLNFNKHIPGSYMINVGDVFYIDIWGAMETSYRIEVTNEFFIIIPQIGKIDLSGSDYSRAKETISARLSRIKGISYSVRLGEVKPVSVFVVGNVAKPGVYNVSPFSTIIEILALAGGVNMHGSLRSISLIDNRTQKRKTADLYSLLFRGENPVSIIDPDMTIFVPLINKQVAVAGNVKKEGIFELRSGDRLKDVVDIAGITPFSDVSRIEIERLDSEGRTYAYSTSLESNPEIRDGDIVRIFSTLVFNPRYVYLKGNFRHNKRVEYRDGMRLLDIFDRKEILKDNTDMNYANIIRKSGLGRRDVMINFSPGGVFSREGDENIELMSRDTVEVFSIDSVSFIPSVKISGMINRPGDYKYTKDMTVSNLLSYSGGLTPRGDKENILVIRNMGKDGLKYYSEVDFDFRLQSDDKIHVFDHTAKNPYNNVRIWGHIKNHGDYIHSEHMTVIDLIGLAGGFRSDAMKDSIEVVSGINEHNRTLETNWYSYDELSSVNLHPNDIVFVRRIRDFGRVNIVKIFGEVMFPGVYAMRENEELADLLVRCGGFTNNAQIKGTQIFRDEVRHQQEVKIRELREELESRIRMNMVLTGNQDLIGALNISKFDSIQASGRIIIDIDEYGNHEQFFFQDRDSIYVPSVSRTILVMGEVNQQTAITYNPARRRVRYYLDKVGGITKTADRKNIYVIKSNGELVRQRGWFDNILNHRLDPGDMVYVPYDYTRIDFLQLTKDVTTILYQLSLSAATVYHLSR